MIKIIQFKNLIRHNIEILIQVGRVVRLEHTYLTILDLNVEP